MAQKYLTSLDLNQNELIRAAVHNISESSVTSPVEGQIIFDTNLGLNHLKVWNGSSWDDLTSGDIAGVTAGTGLVGGGTSGTVTLNIDDTGVTATTYGSSTAIPVITVNAQGQITSATTASITTTLTIAGDSGSGDGVALATETLTIAGGTGLSSVLSGETITVNLDNSGVTAATYGAADTVPVFAVNAQGQITGVTDTSISITSSQITDLGSNSVTTLTGTANEVEVDVSNGNVTVGLPNDVTIGQHLTVNGDLTVNGTTTTVNSTTVTIDDPIFTLGGDSTPTADDNKDRGIEFQYHNGTSALVGFFGFDDSTGKFTFIPDAANSGEVFSGSTGEIDAKVDWSNLLNIDAEISALAGLTSAADALPYFTGSGTASVTTLSSYGRTLIDDADAATARTTLGVAIGTDVQAWDDDLDDLAALLHNNGNFIVSDGTDWTSETPATARDSLATTASGITGTTTARAVSVGCSASNLSGVSTTTVNHNFGAAVSVQVYDASTGETVVGDVTRDMVTNDSVDVVLLGTISANDYTIVVTAA